MFSHSLEVYNDETAPLIDFYTATGSNDLAHLGAPRLASHKTDSRVSYCSILCSGTLRTFEVKKGLADLDKLVDLINTELDA